MEFRREDIFRQIAKDIDLRDEILTKISDMPEIGAEIVKSYLEEVTIETRGLELVSVAQKVDDATRILERPNPTAVPEDLALEAIIRRLARPVLKIINDDFDVTETQTTEWEKRLTTHKERLKEALLSVGRIEIDHNPFYTWVGTGWVVAEDVIVTNRHVANLFAKQQGDRFVFRTNLFGVQMGARIDFREEHMGGDPVEFRILDILHIEADGGPDVAFLRIDWSSKVPEEKRSVLHLLEEIQADDFVATIGYPAKDSRTHIPDEMDAIFANIYDVKRLAPGQVLTNLENFGVFTHDCTTLGGNSGSVVVHLETGKAVGLHFAGKEEYANYAVSGLIVKERLDSLSRGQIVALPVVAVDREDDEAAPRVEDLEDRRGYDPNFLGRLIPLPKPSRALQRNVAPVNGSRDGLLHYTHYSVLMHTTRRLAIYTVVNIDGKNWRHIPRGTDRWYFDPRMDRSFQVGNELYRSNRLDRGHLVRRIDPAWGVTLDEAEIAEKDTFFYTNCAPQHERMNRDIWLGLEDYILDSTEVNDLKVTVFNGPVFRATDRMYRDFQVPEDFWKIVVIVNEETNRLSATGYLLSQLDLMDDLEFAFGAYRTYQVPIQQIEQMTDLSFGDLSSYDPLAQIEARPYIKLERRENLVI